MSDTTSELVEQLAAQGAKVVYLPPSVRKTNIKTCSTSAERQAARPDVIAAAEAYFESPDQLHGSKVVDNSLLNEKPIHRIMIYLHASGASVADIAQQTGYKVHQIYQVLRQPWARLRLVQILKETGQDRVKHFLENEVSPSLEVLREIRDNGAEKAQARLAAANSILNRALGMPTVHVESDNTNRNVPADIVRLDEELASVRKRLAEKGVDSPAGAN